MLKSLTHCQSVTSVKQTVITENGNVAQNKETFFRPTQAETLQPPNSDLKMFLETGLGNE